MPYATLADFKAYRGTSGTGDDELIAALLARAQAQIETATHRIFEAAAGTRYYDESHVCGDELYLDGDLASVTSLTNGNGETIPAAGFWLLPRNKTPAYKIRLKSGYDWNFDTDGEIAVAGMWGYSLTPPADIVQATVRLAAYYYAGKDSQVFDVTAQPSAGIITVPKGLPQDVKVLIDPYRRLGIA